MSALVESINTTINANYPNTKVKSNLVDLLSRLNVELVSAKIMLANNKPIASDLITSFYPVFNKVISGLRVVLLDVKNNQKRFSSIFDSKTNDSFNKRIEIIERVIGKLIETFNSKKSLSIFDKIDINEKSDFSVLIKKLRNENIKLISEFINDKYNRVFKKTAEINKKNAQMLVKNFERVKDREKEFFSYVSSKSVDEFFNDLDLEFRVINDLLDIYLSLQKRVLYSYDSINYLMDDITKNTPKTVPTIKEMMNKEILGIIDEVKKSRKKVMLANPKGFMTGFNRTEVSVSKEAKDNLIKNFNKVRESKSGQQFIDNLNVSINGAKPKKDFERILDKARKDIDVIDKWVKKSF